MIEEPQTNDRFFILKNTSGAGLAITKLVASVRGSSTDCTFTLRHGPDWSATGTAVVTGGTLVNNTTSGQVVTSFNNATIADTDLLWIVIDSVTNGPQQLALQIEF